MRQISLITLYGPKPVELQKLITECQNKISTILGAGFLAYDIKQVHGTIVSLERSSGKSNSNFVSYKKHFEQMDFDGLLHFLRAGGVFPFQVQIGGFTNRDYPFTSRGKRPYERSFILRDDKVVLMGWPIRGQHLTITSPEPVDLIQESRIYPNILDNMRKAVQTYNILHSYHHDPTDVDNDYYFRIVQ